MTQPFSPVTFSTHGRVGVITVHSPPVNALSHAVRSGLFEALTQGGEAPEIAALLLICEGRTFITGADIREFDVAMQAPHLADVIELAEGSTKPIIAAIHGTALGGGFELAMACQFRIALRSAQVGLPEVKLGILPGCGGTQRLPRLIGVRHALYWVVEGDPVGAVEAHALGAIDAVLDGNLLAGGLAFAEEVLAGRRKERGLGSGPIALDDPRAFEDFERDVLPRYPGFLAPAQGVQAVRAACELALKDGLARELELSLALLSSPQSKALRHLFFAEREVAKPLAFPVRTPVRRTDSIAVMGSDCASLGIIPCFLNAGLPVYWVHPNEHGMQGGLAWMRRHLADRVSRGILSGPDAALWLDRLHPTLNLDTLMHVDLAIVAEAEDKVTQQAALGVLDGMCPPGAILATTASRLPLDALAATTRRPDSVVGLHLLTPVHAPACWEIGRGEKTAADVLASMMRLARTLGQRAVLTGAGAAWVSERMQARYVREVDGLLREGATRSQIDRVMSGFGFARGPCYTGDPYERGHARLVPEDEILERCLLAMINESARILDEDAALRAVDIDVLWVNGLGFPRYRGGPLFHADQMGLRHVHDRMLHLQKTSGEQRWQPASLLARLARTDEGFHRR